MASVVKPPDPPILAHLTTIEVIGDLQEKDGDAGRDYFLRISANGEKILESEKTALRALQWDLQDHQILVLPTSLLEIEIYRESSLRLSFLKHLVGRHEAEVSGLLDKDNEFFLKDKAGATIVPHKRIRMSLSSNTNDNLEAFIDSLKADVSCVSAPDGEALGKAGWVSLKLGPSLQVATNFMDNATKLHSILEASWMLLSVAYKALKKKGLDASIQDVASMLQEVLGVAQSMPELLETPDTIRFAKDIGRVSIQMASVIHENTKSSLTGRTWKSQMSDMKSPVEKYRKSWSDLMQLNNYLLESRANGNERYKDSALCAASSEGHEGIVKLLLEKGVDVNAEGGSEGNALIVASNEGHEGIVKLLLKKGANVNMQGRLKGSALVRASSQGHEGIVKLLIESGADVNAEGGSEGEALHAASSEGHEGTVKLLLESGADVDAWGGPKGSALVRASSGGHNGTVKLLLENGADVNAKGGSEGSALVSASSGGHKGTVKLLLENGADVNAAAGREGNALIAASSGGHEGTVKLLLEKGANVNAKGGSDGSALVRASSGGHEGTVKLLLENGANENVAAGRAGNALVAASSEGKVKRLLESEEDVNAKGGSKGSALVRASSRGQEGTVKLLLEKAANTYVQGKYEDDALATALSSHKRIPAVVRLLQRAPNPDPPGDDSDGNALTAVSRSSHKGTKLEPELQSGTYTSTPYSNQDHNLDVPLLRGNKVQHWSQNLKEHEPDSASDAAPQLHNTNSNAELSSMESSLESSMKPTIRWVAAQRALEHAQNRYLEVIQVFDRHGIPESNYSIHAGFYEDLIKSGVGYLEQIHVFLSFERVAGPPELLLRELGQLFTPFSAALFTETSAYEIPVFKNTIEETWDFNELVQAAASKFVDPGLSAVMPPVGNSLSGAAGKPVSPTDSFPGGSNKGDGEDKKGQSTKRKERDHGDDHDGNNGDNNDGGGSGEDPPPPGPGSTRAAKAPATIFFNLSSNITPIPTQSDQGSSECMQCINMTGAVNMQTMPPLGPILRGASATRQVTFQQLTFGTPIRNQLPDASYKQYYIKVTIDSRQKIAIVSEYKPKRTQYSDNAVKRKLDKKDGKTITAGVAVTGSQTPAATITVNRAWVKEETQGTENMEYVNRITQQQHEGLVRWGFHVDDLYNREEGVDLAEGNLPSVTFILRGVPEMMPAPKQTDVQISTYWRLPKPSHEKKTKWRLWSKSSQSVTYSNLCQIVTLEIPADLPVESHYQATLALDLNAPNSSKEPVIEYREGNTEVKPNIKEIQDNFANPYDYWNQDSNLIPRQLPQEVVSETISGGNRKETSARNL